MNFYTIFEDREIITVTGPDARDFLQSMISNDASKITPLVSIYAAILTPQGKFLHDFIISQHGDSFRLDTEKPRASDLVERLKIFRLGSSVEISSEGDRLRVAALWNKNKPVIFGDNPVVGNTATIGKCSVIVDPRVATLGYRIIGEHKNINALITGEVNPKPINTDYDMHRLQVGVPDGSRDIRVNKSFLLESNFEELNGIDFKKGCYVGQENTARMKLRNKVRRRLLPVSVRKELSLDGEILYNEKKVGKILINKPFPFALIKLFDPDLLEFANKDLSSNNSKIKLIRSSFLSP